MPWAVRKSGNKWAIYKPDTGEVVGHSTSKKKAQASVRARYAGTHGEFSENIQNMSDFVRKVVLCHELNEIELEELEIEGKIYERVPDSIKDNLSGGIAAAFGIKIRDGKAWVPKGKLEALVELDNEISEEMQFGEVKLFEFDPNSTTNEGRFRVRDPQEFNQDRIWSEDKWGDLKADGVRFIVGVHKETGKPELQAIRFDKTKWLPSDTSKWIKDNNLKRISQGEFK